MSDNHSIAGMYGRLPADYTARIERKLHQKYPKLNLQTKGNKSLDHHSAPNFQLENTETVFISYGSIDFMQVCSVLNTTTYTCCCSWQIVFTTCTILPWSKSHSFSSRRNVFYQLSITQNPNTYILAINYPCHRRDLCEACIKPH